ncbi:cytochrome c3 family protein [Methyloprofundus sp.]|uniref:cytochrome c3 family protein n=1 Tax=Methyloprofundus sp. TaxID=2020875 RepID=UPI003D1421C2
MIISFHLPKDSGREDAKKFGTNHPLGVKMLKPPQKGQHLSTDDPHLQKGLPKVLQAGGGVLLENDAIGCQSCHQVHEGATKNLLTQTDESSELCASCHKRQAPKDKKAARKAGVHPVNVELEEPVEFRGEKVKTVQCASCHSVHDGTLDTALYPDKIKDAEKLCIACHERQHAKDEDEAAKKGIHPMNLELDEAIKIEGVDVKKIGCLSCHAVHSGKPNTPALLQDHKNGKLCENCHAGKQRVVGTDHDFRVTTDETENQQEETPHQSGVCGSCHTLHRGEEKNIFLSAVVESEVKDRDKTAPGLKVDEMCMNCHQKEGIGKDKEIEFYGHPYQDMVLRSDEKVMPLLEKEHEEIEELGVIACITCHDPHSWKPVKNPEEKNYPVLNYKKQENIEGDITNSYLRHKGVEKTFCVDCHGIEALPKYKYYHHEDKVRGIGVDYLK